MDLYLQCVNTGDKESREKENKEKGGEKGMILPGTCRCPFTFPILKITSFSPRSILQFLLEHAISKFIYCTPG